MAGVPHAAHLGNFQYLVTLNMGPTGASGQQLNIGVNFLVYTIFFFDTSRILKVDWKKLRLDLSYY